MKADVGQELARHISDHEAEALLFNLISISSPSGQEGEAAQYLAEWMTEHGFQAFVDDSGSAVGVRGEGEREIVLLGHVDTFPGVVPVRLEGRRLYGRGSVDAKGPLAAFVVAAASIDPPPGSRLVVIGATEEEAATSRGARFALQRHHPVACVIGEPSGWDRITVAYKGRLLADWSWYGPLAHSAGPMPTPAEQAVAYWLRLHHYAGNINIGHRASFDQLDVSLRSICTQPMGAYGVAEMHLSLRLPPRISAAEVEARMCELSDGAWLRFFGREEPFIAEKNTFLCRAMLRAVRAHGGRPRFVRKTGTSDMNVVGPVWKCPIVAYGPGDARLDHTPEEHIDLDEFERSIAVLHHALGEILINESA
jgi:LysW-gamma-L-lysine carboxypeptidase